MTLLQFEAWALFPEVPFWTELARIKLHEWRDRTPTADIVGTYGALPFQAETASRLAVDQEAFRRPAAAGGGPSVRGHLFNTNTIEEFQRADRKRLLQDAAEPVRQAIADGSWLDDPVRLNAFVVLSFADLKAHKFFYMAGFPALLPPESFKAAETAAAADVFPPAQREQLAAQLAGARAAGAFAIWRTGADVAVRPLASLRDPKPADAEVFLGLVDTSALPSNPGWPLRNLLLAVAHSGVVAGPAVRVVCVRSAGADLAGSIVLTVELPAGGVAEALAEPRVVGWEAPAPGKKNAVHVVDLSTWMDPTKLASSAASLNLSLMKWRNLPELDVERLARMKCLLVGSGTLGCNVARNLMMWGVLDITFVDYGRVSYSNPVRQTLFEFADCQGGGKPKAVAAAEACRRIHPGAQTAAHVLSVPMPGHPLDPKQRAAVEQDVARLDELVRAADAVFILTDSRESRWLPTVLGAIHDKLVVNAGLGFASYTVMRHGSDGQADARLGCYFCNDSVAPRDSMSDRTLDQQCTVTRPGVSAVASALAVELFAAVLQHPRGKDAPAEHESGSHEGVLGLAPHQIRGNVLSFEQSVLSLPAFSKCTACSPAVRSAYQAEGFGLVEKVMNTPEILEEITGWKEEQRRTEAAIAEWEDADGDGDDF